MGAPWTGIGSPDETAAEWAVGLIERPGSVVQFRGSMPEYGRLEEQLAKLIAADRTNVLRLAAKRIQDNLVRNDGSVPTGSIPEVVMETLRRMSEEGWLVERQTSAGD
jgi:hypothetical protein